MSCITGQHDEASGRAGSLANSRMSFPEVFIQLLSQRCLEKLAVEAQTRSFLPFARSAASLYGPVSTAPVYAARPVIEPPTLLHDQVFGMFIIDEDTVLLPHLLPHAP